MLRLALAISLAALSQEKDDSPPPEKTHVVQKGSLIPLFELEAGYESVESAEFKAKLEAFTGDLVILKVASAGCEVRKGELFLAIDQGPLEKQLAAAEVDLRVAQAGLEKSQADSSIAVKAESIALAQAETALKDALASLKVFDDVEGKYMILQADLNVKFGEEHLSDQKEELDQLLAMYKSEELTNATAELVVRRARRGLERAQTFLQMNRDFAQVIRDVRHPQARQAFVHGADAAQNSLDALKAQQAQSRVQREADAFRVRAALAQQEDLLARLRRDAERFEWKAPFDGRVFHGQLQHGQWCPAPDLLQPGEKLPPGQTLITLCGAKSRVRALLPEADYFEVRPGMAATVSPVAAPDVKAEGEVRSKSAAAVHKGAEPTFDLWIDLKEPPTDLLPGMRGKVEIRGRAVENAVVVPSEAIATMGPKSTVTVRKDGKSSPREVTTGRSDGKRTVVKSGLEPGEEIVVPR